MSTHKLAVKAHLARNSAGTYGSPAWANADSTRDATWNIGWDKGEAFTRASRMKLYAKTMADMEVTAQVKVCDAADYSAFYDAAFSDSALDMLILDGPATEEGSMGVRAYFQVFAKNQDQAINNVLYDEFQFAPSPGANPPKMAEVGSGGTITFTAI